MTFSINTESMLAHMRKKQRQRSKPRVYNMYNGLLYIGSVELGSMGLHRFEPAASWAARFAIPRKRSAFPLPLCREMWYAVDASATHESQRFSFKHSKETVTV